MIYIHYIVAEYRNKKVNFNGLNMYYNPDEYLDQFVNLDIIVDKLKFIIIGSTEGL